MCVHIVRNKDYYYYTWGKVPPEQVPVPGVNSCVNVRYPGTSVPIQSKCVCRVSLYIEMKLYILSHFSDNLYFYLQ